ISREGLTMSSDEIQKLGSGGLSGKPLSSRSTEIIRYLRSKNNSITIIGVGGITDVTAAIAKLKAGADLIQIYTGFIYKGPGLIRRINQAMIDEGEILRYFC
ncbi:MAG: dihydroorotate dehydrogenase (quinone), partial [Proteobacteria bacterium]|nr:dihydroorotate dehydrogenase (quinone) [Pseudomonadota bacterium]